MGRQSRKYQLINIKVPGTSLRSALSNGRPSIGWSRPPGRAFRIAAAMPTSESPISPVGSRITQLRLPRRQSGRTSSSVSRPCVCPRTFREANIQ